MNTKSSIFTSGGATSETITVGVHEWNKNWSWKLFHENPVFWNSEIESDYLTVWNSEIISFDFTEKSL